jgi:hypothetical protein
MVLLSTAEVRHWGSSDAALIVLSSDDVQCVCTSHCHLTVALAVAPETFDSSNFIGRKEKIQKFERAKIRLIWLTNRLFYTNRVRGTRWKDAITLIKENHREYKKSLVIFLA